MRALVIYHGNCHDGFTAAWIAHRVLCARLQYDEVALHAAQYGQPAPAVTREDHVWVLDFSYPLASVVQLQQAAGAFVLLDHHKTALGLAEIRGVTIDLEQSGAMLAWGHFMPGQAAPKLVQYVQDRDLWRFHLYKSREVNAWIRSWPMDLTIWDNLEISLSHEDRVRIVADEGGAILRNTSREIDEACRHARLVWLSGYRVPMLNAPWHQSEIGQQLCRNYPAAPFSATWFLMEGKRVISLRTTREDFDVSTIAQRYGGGGHRAAAGFQVPAESIVEPFTECEDGQAGAR